MTVSQPIVCNINDLGIFRGGSWLIYQFSCTIAEGECWLLTGTNGSGKTSLLRVIGGLCLPDKGNIVYTRNKSDNPFLMYLASPPPKILELSVIDNIRYQALLRMGKQFSDATLHKALAYWEMRDLANQPVFQLSQGQQQCVALTLLLLESPRLWLLDEPTTALDATRGDMFWALCREHQQKGGSLMIATHQMPTVEMYNMKYMQLGIPTAHIDAVR
ncbi:MAG: cytochrome c biosis ATP-binding export protein CcmA [Pseudomonadota bacterium]|jgi:heme exporter protein A